jgi:hypothetical protein
VIWPLHIFSRCIDAEPIYIGHTTHPVGVPEVITYVMLSLTNHRHTDYENQRLHLLHKHGIDLEDSIADGRKTKRMTPREIELLMGGGDGQVGIFTWRDKHRRKVSGGFDLICSKALIINFLEQAGIFSVRCYPQRFTL